MQIKKIKTPLKNVERDTNTDLKKEVNFNFSNVRSKEGSPERSPTRSPEPHSTLMCPQSLMSAQSTLEDQDTP